jgi:hypothetical protein
MAAPGTQRSSWVTPLIVAVIGALGVIGAAVLPGLLDRGTEEQVPSPSLSTNPPTRVNEMTIQAEAVIERSGDMQLRDDSGVAYLSYITVGAWAMYEGEGLGAGEVHSVTAKVASATQGGDIDIRLDGADGRLIARCSVPNTGGWLSWSTIVCEPLANVPSTPSQIHLGFRGSPTPENPYLFNLDWVKLS